MHEELNKPAVAVYQRHYLTASMTFVYRQLLGIKDEFEPIVLAYSVSNLERFPCDRLSLRERTVADKVWCRLRRLLTGSVAALSPFHERAWKGVLASNRIRLIHAHFGPSGIDVLPLARSLGIPLIVTFHGFDASALLNDRSYLRAVKGLFAYAHIITVSKKMSEALIKAGADGSMIDVHYIGVPVEDFEYIERRPLTEKVSEGGRLEFLQVSNLLEKKGHAYTIKAFKGFLSKYPDSRLTIAGDGPLRGSLERLCSELGITGKVNFTGCVDTQEVKRLMSASDIFVHHSVTASNGDMEGIPTVIMEAMATGLPVISTVHSGIPELVDDGVSGLLVAEKDIDAYVKALFQSVESGHVLGKNARSKVLESFNMEKQNAALKGIYRKMLRKCKAS